MAEDNTEDLQSMISETRSSNEEAIRLFHLELRPLIHETNVNVVVQASIDNLEWAHTHILRVSDKLDKLDIEIQKWRQMKEKLLVITDENEDINKLYMDEKRRTVALYQSIQAATASQQSQESQIHNLKLKCRTLQRDNKKALARSTEITCELRRFEDKCRNIVKVRERKIKDCALSSSSMENKKARISTSGGSSSSSKSSNITHSETIDSNIVQDTSSSSSPPNPRKRSITSCSDVPQHDLFTALNGNGSASISNMCVSVHTEKPNALDSIQLGSHSQSSNHIAPPNIHALEINNKKLIINVESNQPSIQTSLRKVPNQGKAINITDVREQKHPVQKKEPSDSVQKKLSPESKVESYIGGEIKKPFRGYSGIFTGVIKSYKCPYYNICYEDGDKEEMTETEMLRWLVVVKKK